MTLNDQDRSKHFRVMCAPRKRVRNFWGPPFRRPFLLTFFSQSLDQVRGETFTKLTSQIALAIRASLSTRPSFYVVKSNSCTMLKLWTLYFGARSAPDPTKSPQSSLLKILPSTVAENAVIWLNIIVVPNVHCENKVR